MTKELKPQPARQPVSYVVKRALQGMLAAAIIVAVVHVAYGDSTFSLSVVWQWLALSLLSVTVSLYRLDSSQRRLRGLGKPSNRREGHPKIDGPQKHDDRNPGLAVRRGGRLEMRQLHSQLEGRGPTPIRDGRLRWSASVQTAPASAEQNPVDRGNLDANQR
jgi:hypothetical protein